MTQPAVRQRSPFPLVVALCLVPLLSHLIIIATSHVRLGLGTSVVVLFKLGFVTVSAVTHWLIYAGLLLTFALTLRHGHEPLITAMARRMHGGIDATLARYTRGVTIAWSLFFAAQLGVSIALFFLAPLVVWSFFVNILDIPLIATMFLAEYTFRLHYLQDPPRHSIAMIMKMVADIRKPNEIAATPL